MNDQPETADDGSVSPTSTPEVRESQPVGSPPAEPASAQQLAKVEKEMTGFEKATLWCARIAVVMSALAALFVCAQWYEMHEGSKDTHALAIAAGNQSVAAGQQAQAAQTQSQQAIAQTEELKESLSKTDALIVEASKQATETNRLASAADRSAVASETANKQTANLFKVQNRPWVGLDGEMTLDSFSAAPDGTPRMVVGYKLKNVGDAPALNTIAWLNTFTADVDNYNLVKTQVDQSCKSAENLVPTTGDLFLPSMEKSDTWGMSAQKGFPSKFIISGCVAYRDGVGSMHHTQICYWFDRSSYPKPESHGTCWFQAAD